MVDVIEDEYSNLSSIYHEWYWKNPFQTAASWDHLCIFKPDFIDLDRRIRYTISLLAKQLPELIQGACTSALVAPTG